MKKSEIFRRAAKIVEREDLLAEHRCCCRAICDAVETMKDESKALDFFAAWIMPLGASPSAFWYGDCMTEANRGPRILALCFAAAIAESEGD